MRFAPCVLASGPGGVNRASCVCIQAVAALFAAPAAARSPWETGAGMGGMESTLPMPAPGSVIERIAVPADNSCLSGYCANEAEHGFPMRTLQDEIALHAELTLAICCLPRPDVYSTASPMSLKTSVLSAKALECVGTP